MKGDRWTLYRLILPFQLGTLCIAISYMFLICDAEYYNMQTGYYSLLQNIDCSPSNWNNFSTLNSLRKNYNFNFDNHTLKLDRESQWIFLLYFTFFFHFSPYWKFNLFTFHYSLHFCSKVNIKMLQRYTLNIT